MALSGKIDVSTFEGTLAIEVRAGTSLVFVGANGAGKTRLGVLLDTTLSRTGMEVHRIAAHRSLILNPAVVPPSYEVATKRFFYGTDQGTGQNKNVRKYNQKPETELISDFDHVLSALYADNNDVSIKYRQDVIAGVETPHVPPPAKIDLLKAIWDKALPHRELVVLSGNLKKKL